MTEHQSQASTREVTGDGVTNETALAVWIQNTGTVHERTAEDATTTLCGRIASREDEFDGVAVRPCWTCVRIHLAAETESVANAQER